MKPVIGITIDSIEIGDYSKFPYYALRKDYSKAIFSLGGIPILLPQITEMAEEYVNSIDGLIISGGDFDIDPIYYGQHNKHDKVILNQQRTSFESTICKLALKNKMPIMGICGGEQLLNVILGGTLIQHIPDAVPNALEHEQPHPKNLPWHDITILNGTKYHDIVQVKSVKVNSTHHQAVDNIAPNMLVSAKSSDGIIEAIELKDYPFCIGVQWHPEYLNGEHDHKLFVEFINQAKKYHGQI